METEVEFTVALPVSADRLYLAASPDAMPAHSELTRLYHHDARGARPWTHHDVPWWTVALAKHRESDDAPWTLCALSEEGDLEFVSRGRAAAERVPDAGLRGPSSKGYGYVAAMRWIGDHIYVCGAAGQIYKRLDPDRWEHVDQGLLQTRDVEDRLVLRAVDGPAEDDVYVAGELPGPLGLEGRLFHGDGARFRPVALPKVGGINAIHVDDDRRIWIAGHKGALLVGDRFHFTDVSPRGSAHLFYDVCRYRGTLYLASVYGLFRYDEEQANVVRVSTGLSPELQRVHTVEHVDGVLWCVGPKEIARFDGEAWTRVHHPDNPRIGG